MNAEHAADEPIAEYEITEASGAAKKWTLSLYPAYLGLQSADAGPHEVERAELREQVQTYDSGLFLRHVVVVTLGKRKVIFRLSPETFAALSAWIGPPTLEDLKLSLKRRFGWVLPIGVLFVLTALPIGDLPWEPISLGLGLALILTATLAKVRPHRIFFALDSLWFSFLVANSVCLLVQEWSWLRLVLLLMQLALVQSGWHEYRRFAPERMAAEEVENA